MPRSLFWDIVLLMFIYRSLPHVCGFILAFLTALLERTLSK